MNKSISLFFIVFTLFSCGQGQMKTSNNIVAQLQDFKKKNKFELDKGLFYPGIADTALKPILTKKINLAADDFIEIASDTKPTPEKYHKKIQIGLGRFSEIYLSIDTEDRERICSYYEELMGIVGLKNSDGQLNEFMYGFNADSK